MTETITTDEGTFKVGEKVIYSDLSPWESGTITGFGDDDTVAINFDDDLEGTHPLAGCMPCGLRKYTEKNIENYLS